MGIKTYVKEFFAGLRGESDVVCYKCGKPVPAELLEATGTDYCEACLAKHLGEVHCPACKYAGKADVETIQQGGRTSMKGPAEPALVALKCPRCHDTIIEIEVSR